MSHAGNMNRFLHCRAVREVQFWLSLRCIVVPCIFGPTNCPRFLHPWSEAKQVVKRIGWVYETPAEVSSSNEENTSTEVMEIGSISKRRPLTGKPVIPVPLAVCTQAIILSPDQANAWSLSYLDWVWGARVTWMRLTPPRRIRLHQQTTTIQVTLADLSSYFSVHPQIILSSITLTRRFSSARSTFTYS